MENPRQSPQTWKQLSKGSNLVSRRNGEQGTFFFPAALGTGPMKVHTHLGPSQELGIPVPLESTGGHGALPETLLGPDITPPCFSLIYSPNLCPNPALHTEPQEANPPPAWDKQKLACQPAPLPPSPGTRPSWKILEKMMPRDVRMRFHPQPSQGPGRNASLWPLRSHYLKDGPGLGVTRCAQLQVLLGQCPVG